MAKEFRRWDKEFSAEELAAERREWLGDQAGSQIMTYVHFSKDIKVWSNVDIRKAVYLAPDARDWQRFRVAMKGLDTYDKLFMVITRRHFMIDEHTLGHIDDEQYRNEIIRSDNYIGALRRGGQLNEWFEVVK